MSEDIKLLREWIEKYPSWFPYATKFFGMYTFPKTWLPVISRMFRHIEYRYNKWNRYNTRKERILSHNNSLHDDPYIKEYFEKYPTNPWDGFRIYQIKTKFGQMRFYYDFVNEDEKHIDFPIGQAYLDGLIAASTSWAYYIDNQLNSEQT